MEINAFLITNEHECASTNDTNFSFAFIFMERFRTLLKEPVQPQTFGNESFFLSLSFSFSLRSPRTLRLKNESSLIIRLY